MTPSDDLAAIETFADALWMERGLSRNTLSAYQSDLRKTAAWLAAECGRDLCAARREDLLGFLAAELQTKADGTQVVKACATPFAGLFIPHQQ